MMRWTILLSTLLASSFVVAQEPVEIVRNSTDQVIRLVDENRELYEQRPEQLREDIRKILTPTIDAVYTARLVLGRHGRDLEQEQVEAFSDALADLLLKRYASALLEYDLHDRLEILPLTGENTERMTRVRTRIRLDGSNRAPMDYIFRKSEGQWRVFDVIVEGISYVATFRNQIGEEIRRDGFDGLMERLRNGEIELGPDE